MQQSTSDTLSMEIVVREDGTRHAGCDESSGWVWFAARVLETEIIAEINDISELRILELGSGTGWLSLRLAQRGAWMTATERLGALPLLTQNVLRNQSRFCVPENDHMELEVDIHQLECWDNEEEIIPGQWDLFIGSDVMYMHENHLPLLRTLIRHKCNTCILSWETRHPKEEEKFPILARELGFVCEPPQVVATNSGTGSPIWLLKMTYCASADPCSCIDEAGSSTPNN